MGYVVRIIECLLFLGLVILQWLVPKKMGIMRSLQYRDMAIENSLFATFPETGAFIMVIILLVLVLMWLFKIRNGTQFKWWFDVVLIILALTLLIISRQAAWPIYYFSMLFAIIVGLVQVFNIWLHNKKGWIKK